MCKKYTHPQFPAGNFNLEEINFLHKIKAEYGFQISILTAFFVTS